MGSAGFSPGSAGSVSLAFDAGVPHVAFIDGGYGQRATVMRYNGSTWEIVGSAGFSASIANSTSLGVDTGILYVAFGDIAVMNKVTVMKYAE